MEGKNIIIASLAFILLGVGGLSVWQSIQVATLRNELRKMDDEQFKQLDEQETFWRKQIVSYTDSIKLKDAEIDLSKANLAKLKRKLKDLQDAPIPNVDAMDTTELLLELRRIRAAYHLR